MPSNVQFQSSTLATPSAGEIVATKSITHDGDTAEVQLIQLVGVSGSEDAYTVHEISPDANGIYIQGAAAENAAVAGNPVLIGGRYDATPRTLGDGDAGAFALDADGAVQISDGGNSITIDGTVTANLSATDNAVLDTIETNTDFGTVTGGGAEATALRVTIANDSTGLVSIDDGGGSLTVDNSDITTIAGAVSGSEMQVDIVSGNVTNAGTFAVQEDGAALTALQLIDDIVYTDDTDTHSTGTSKGALFMAAATPTDSSVGANDIGAVAMSTDRRLLVDAQIVGQDSDITIADGGNSITIDGTVTANLSATDNAVLDTIETNTDFGTVTGGGVEASALRVTLANDSTGVLSVDDNGGSLTVDNADITTVAGAVSGSEMQVDVVSAGSSTFTVGGVAAHDAAVSGNPILVGAEFDDTATDTVDEGDIGRLRINNRRALYTTMETPNGDNVWDDANDALQVNVVAGSGSGTEYVEDAAAAANPQGGMPVFVRADTPATLTSTDGDVVAQRGSDYGAGYVTILDGSGNIISSFGGSGGTSHADDAAFSIGSASSITPTGYLADETTPDSVDEGDVGVPRMTLSRKPYAVITDATSENNAAVDGSGHLQVDIAADSVGIGGGTQYAVDDALGATPTGTLALASRDDALGGLSEVEGDAVQLRVDENGALWVIPNGTVTVTDDGSFVLAANDGVDIGDVTLNNGFASVTGGGVESSALRVTLASDSTGVLSVDDGGGSLTVDNADITTIAGAVSGSEMQVDIVSGNVTNAGTFVVQEDGAALTALQLIDDIVYTDDTDTHATGSSKGALLMAAATPTDSTVTANDIGALAMSTDRRLLVDAQIAGQDADVTIADGGNSITVDSADLSTIAGAVSGTEMQVDVVSSAAIPVTDNSGSLTVDWNGTAPPIGAGTEATALRVTVATDSTGVLSIDDNGSTLSIDDGGGAITVDGTVTVTDGLNIEGDVAHDGADSGNPVKIGLRAIAHGTNPTAVAAADRTHWYANRAGIPFMIGGHPNVITREYYATSAQTNDAIIDSISAGTKIVVTAITVTVDEATTVGVGARIGFGATTLPTAPTDGNSATGVVLRHAGIAAGSGVSRGDGSGILAIGGDGEELRITSDAPTSGSLAVIVTYYTVPS